MADSSEGFVVEEKPAPNSLVVKTNGVNYRSNNVWQTLKPLVNGFLTGQLNFLQFYSTYWGAKKMLPQMLPHVEELHGSDHAAQCKNILNVARKDEHWSQHVGKKVGAKGPAAFASFEIG